MKRTILLLLGGVLLFSCQTNKAVISTDYFDGSSFSGTLPCTDCGGIKQVVVLDSGNTFRLSETYVGKEEKCKEKCGRWAVRDGKVMLYSDTSSIAQYAVSGGNLVYLDQNNLSYNGGFSGEGMLSRKKFTRSKKINEKFLDGLDIVAFGSDASWSLDVNHSEAIQFSVPGTGAPFAVLPVSPTLSGDSLVYDIRTSADNMKIVLRPGVCAESTSDNVYDYKVTIQFNGRTYTGCGAVTNADGSLDGVWNLQNFEGHNGKAKEKQYVTIDMANGTFFGNTGCNIFSGKVRLRDQKLCFSDINIGGKECKEIDEQSLIDVLIRCNGYSISGTTLTLQQNGADVITFQRKLEGDSNEL